MNVINAGSFGSASNVKSAYNAKSASKTESASIVCSLKAACITDTGSVKHARCDLDLPVAALPGNKQGVQSWRCNRSSMRLDR